MLDSVVPSSRRGHWGQARGPDAAGPWCRSEGTGEVRRTAATITAGAMIFLAGCSGDDPGGSAEPTAEAAPEAQVSLSVADGSADVSPVSPLEIAVSDGELTDVTLVDAAGAQVPGAVADADDSGSGVWTPETPLAYGTQYTLSAAAVNEDDAQTSASSTFTTVAPTTLSTPSIGPLDGQTVGVGMPIRVWFDDPVADKAAVESHLEVTSSTPTDGVWSWFNDAEVHFRPSTYWPANTEVTLDANLYGVDFGEGVWGRRTAASASRSAPSTSRSPTRRRTPSTSTTATSSCRASP
ncbi:Ig-like domain-containing protein [Blastococcus brunescens]|uniref:Ig-like domain-containing protein n=1 Tax=Blastococcus brunescens TaxID=1564165 RepID=A0ABZ1B917_9ACTN|nr:Ig-like domain-containing protein [Blastococcus sp. BMG 8361]WRL66872.1 Ig-like domain-containing protein [Blastococcus sp. BMG 8361]